MTNEQNRTEGPKFVQYFAPVLEALRLLGGSGSPSEVADKVAELMKISTQHQEELLASGAPRFLNQIQWARFYLSQDGYISSSRRGVWTLTDKGRDKKLNQSEAMEIFSRIAAGFAKSRRSSKKVPSETEVDTPEEAEQIVSSSYRERLLQIIKALPPSGFEKLCQRLLREAGFKQVTVTGRSGDRGIDGVGILQINPFVSFQVLFQCKRYDDAVSPSHVRDFRGAMEGRTDKGIIITTGTFTSEAKKEAFRDGAKPIELVDGQKLIEMFESLELGLKPTKAFEVDDDFFNEFRKT
jgi:restriction system protein